MKGRQENGKHKYAFTQSIATFTSWTESVKLNGNKIGF